MKAFTVEQHPDGFYFIQFFHPKFMGGQAAGSFNVIGARILGLNFANYLRYLRDDYNAEIRGRKGYSTAIFKEQGDCLMAVQELNNCFKSVEKMI